MSRTRRLSIAGAICLGLVIAFISVVMFVDPLRDPEFDARFERVRVGMNESEVIRILGPPLYESSEFRLGQREGFEAVYDRAARSGAGRYLSWERGGDFVYTVGLNDSQRVVIAESGGT